MRSPRLRMGQRVDLRYPAAETERAAQFRRLGQPGLALGVEPPELSVPYLREREERRGAVVSPSERVGDLERDAQMLLRFVVSTDQRRELADVRGNGSLTRDAVERDLVRKRPDHRQEQRR